MREKLVLKGETRNFLSIASVAQLVEQLTLNQLVDGSSPSRGTTSTKIEAKTNPLAKREKKAVGE